MENLDLRQRAINDLIADEPIWLEEGTANRGWYTCIITGKKMRGEEAREQLAMQEQSIQDMMEVIQELEGEEEESQETQEDISLPLENSEGIAVADSNSEPKKVAHKRKLSLDEVQEKYPHVIKIVNIEFTDEDMNNKDYMGLLQTKADLQGISDSLADWLCLQMDTGKNDFCFYRIKCGDCKEYRVIKPQDAFQVKRCDNCSRAYKNQRRKKSL